MIPKSVASIVRVASFMGALAASVLAGDVLAQTSIPRLVNIATRGQVLTGSDVMIAGFIISGSANKTVVVRARGPSLTAAGVPGALANPMLQLFSGQTQIAVNDNWQTAANVATLQASGFAPSDPLEAAIYISLAPGAYTGIVTGVGSTTGVGIVEVFEVDRPDVPLINIATRGKVLTGSDVMIGGFIIQGTGQQTVVVRARGPSLTAQGVPGVLADPNLQLFSGATQLTANDNWQSAANAAQVTASGFAPSSTLESAILATLDPGAYTAIVSGVALGTGVGIVEVFATTTTTNFTLTVTKAGTGSGTVTSTSPAGLINCGTTCSGSAASGTSVTLTATPAAGSVFSGWSGACTGTANCVLTLDAAKSVTATFGATGAGKTYFLATTGSDTNNGLTVGAPFKTFAKAWGVMVADDKLMVADGTYTNASPPTGKAGALGQPIVVQATNPGGVSLGQVDFKGTSYITLIGFKVSGPDYAVAIFSNGVGKASHHLTFQQIGFSCTPGTLNDGACFDIGDGANNILLEDSWGYGGGRYTILCYGGPGGNPPNLTCDNNTFRRVVIRMGPALSSGGNPQASLGLYYASNNIVENVIAIDGKAASDSSNAAFYITGHAPPPNADANKFYGVIALNNLGGGYYLDCPGAICNANEVHNSVFWASQQYGIAISASSAAGDSCANVIINRNTVGFSGTGESGYDNYACDNATLTNNAFVSNTGYGATQSSSQGSTTTNHHNGYFGNTKGARQNLSAGTGDLTSNPGLAYIARIEAASPYKNAGVSGDIGANVVNRYQDGVLTGTSLWPYPFEARLRAEMCATSTGNFCTSGKTLTQYIWGYLGSAIPPGY